MLLLAMGLASGAGTAGHGATAEPALGPMSSDTSALEDLVRAALREARADGFIEIRDVPSGQVLVHVTGPATGAEPALGADSLVAPLSVIKVFVAASWIEHGFGDVPVDCRPEQLVSRASHARRGRPPVWL